MDLLDEEEKEEEEEEEEGVSHRTLDAFRNKKSTHSIWFDPSYLPIPIQIDIQRYRFKIILCFITYTWSSSSPTQAPRVNNVKSCRGSSARAQPCPYKIYSQNDIICHL
ncbi:hypothetical protein ACN38_g5465 [Penicillium nordicum]|uniref:Uncharacterized protein n=1 Tax=Penicillium nordicum TaxID=229535 RepID=A0A0M8P4Y4_9EURO|nr:hypothetical protein ACN38_g5465 [Penicillium nordicum]